MKTTSYAGLSVKEFVHLSEHALKMGEWERAQTLASEAVRQFPNGDFSYLYGAICAHQKEFDLAVEWLTDALDRGTVFKHPAAFQLGLIEISGGNIEAAKLAWLALDGLESDHYYHQFADGMVALVENRFDEAESLIKQGIVLNDEYESINVDMRYVLEQLELIN